MQFGNINYFINFEFQSTFKIYLMNKQEEQLNAIKDIRTLMERSSRFLPLSGIAGVIIGMLAFACIISAYLYLGIALTQPGYYDLVQKGNGEINVSVLTFLLADFGIVLIASLFTGIVMSMRKAKKQGLIIWDASAKRMLSNFFIPLFTGGLFCLILLYHHQIALIVPATLIFYGLSLLNASKYTINDIRYLGILIVATGLLASLFIDYGLLLWAFGFGVLHIVYGITIYFKYEK